MTTSAVAMREKSFDAMGSRVHLVATSPTADLAEGERYIRHLEVLWTRFAGNSDLSRLNALRTTTVAAETMTLIDHMIEAWRGTAGRFDPTMGAAMRAIGYDRDFGSGLDSDGRLRRLPGAGCENIQIDRLTSTVTLPDGVHLDAGGIGKGLAADLLASRLAGADSGVLVNVGGDLKAMGPGPADGAWIVDVAEPTVADGVIARVALPSDSALATSTPLKRKWRRGDETAHHLLDPVTGGPHVEPAALITVVAADAWWAEAVTKQLVGLAPVDAEDLVHEAAALIIDLEGNQHFIGGMEKYLV